MKTVNNTIALFVAVALLLIQFPTGTIAFAEEPEVDIIVEHVVEHTDNWPDNLNEIPVRLFVLSEWPYWSAIQIRINYDPEKLTFYNFDLNNALVEQRDSGEPVIMLCNKDTPGEVIISVMLATYFDDYEGYYNIDEEGWVYDYLGRLVFSASNSIEPGLYEINATVEKLLTFENSNQAEAGEECFPDFDSDGEITIADAIIAQRVSIGFQDELPEWILMADIDGDGHVTLADSLSILRYAARRYGGFCKTVDMPFCVTNGSVEIHDWSEWEVTTPATCTASGGETRMCSRCDYVEFREIEALGHAWGDWEVTPATCTEAGEETRVCANDPTHIETRSVDALGHAWGEWEVTTPATCTAYGEEARVCANDPTHVEIRVIEALGHAWGEWTVKTPATCTEKGEETRVCNNDPSHVETRVIKATGHDWGEWTVKTPATCTASGEETRVCKNNPSHVETRVINALGHAWGEWTPIDGRYGWEHRICLNDSSHIEEREIILSSGRCGDDMYWSLTMNGVLVISGTGGMYDYHPYDNPAPWCVFGDSVKEVLIESGVITIGQGAFAFCESLEKVTIPEDGPFGIDFGAFYGCVSLKSIYIPANVIVIVDGAFSKSYIESVEVSEYNPIYHVDGNCIIATEMNTLVAGFKNSVIPSDGSVTAIGPLAFSECDGLTSITIPDCVTSIGFAAFAFCNDLTSVVIPDSVCILAEGVFKDCPNLKNVTFGSGLKEIGDSAFENCLSLRAANIPVSVERIGDMAFYNCLDLSRITIAGGPYIGEYAFHRTSYYNNFSNWQNNGYMVLYINKCLIEFIPGNNNLFYDILNNTVSIAGKAFDGCSNMIIKVPAAVKIIGKDAFAADDAIILNVIENSYAHKYAKENGIRYALTETNLGDADGDGKITVSDALAALRIAAKLVVPTADDFAVLDIDGDGVIAVNDALSILRVAAKLVDSL